MENRKMKPSGIEWIGDIPFDWNVVPVKYFFSIGRGRVISVLDLCDDGKYPVYSSQTENNGCFGYLNTYDYSGPAITWTTDGAKAGTVFFRDGKYNCTNVCGILTFKNDNFKRSNIRFMTYAIGMAAEQNKRKDINGYKIMSNEMANIRFAVPSLDIQNSIAKFLDQKCLEIDALVTDIQSQIDILEEYKKSVITEVITNGLNPNVKMKNSGIEWIGLVSEDANIFRLKFFSYMKGRIGWQGLKSTDFIDDGPYCVTGTDFQNGKVNWETCYHVSEKRYEMDSNIHIKEGDLLMTKDGTIGKLAIIDELPDKACLNSHLLIIRPLENKYINKYLYYVMQSHIFSKYYTLVSSGSTMDSLSQEKTGNFSIPSYSIEKQKKIVEYLDNKCLEINAIISEKKQQIETLTNCKTSLIYYFL